VAGADDTTSTKRIWLRQAWALVAEAYGNLTEEVLTEELAEGRVRSWDDSGPIKPEFWCLDLEINPARNSARERIFRMMVLDPSSGRVTDSSNPPCEHHGITLAHADVRALLPTAETAPLRTTEAKTREGRQAKRVLRVLPKCYPPDGKVPDDIPTTSVQQKVNAELEREAKELGLTGNDRPNKVSWETVDRALGRSK
jgi:hypothetical protein